MDDAELLGKIREMIEDSEGIARAKVAAVESLVVELEDFAENGEISSGIGMGWRRGVQIAAHNLRERLASVGRTEAKGPDDAAQ